MMNHEYYHIYENNHPIIGASFQTKKEARRYLINTASLIESKDSPRSFFAVYERRLKHLPIRDILFLKKIYADKHEETVTLVIRHIKMSPFNTSF